MSTASPTTVKVMLVDDSVVIRGALTKILEEDPDIEILATARNGQNALEILERKKPDVIVLDVEMPVMDGLTALPLLLQKSPKSKVIMFSSLTEKGAQVSIKAMSLGAVECLVKPQAGEAQSGGAFQKQMTTLIKHIGPPPSARSPSLAGGAPAYHAPVQRAKSDFTLRKNLMDYAGQPSILAIGSSTGGPQALFKVMKNLKDLPIPIVITQHMPATFTKILAEHITQQSGVPCFEGETGMGVVPGQAYVAPGGYHMLIERDMTSLKIRLSEGPPENFCKPSVDPMMRSVIDIFGKKVLCAILTGMGNDGLPSAKTLVNQGGRVIAQDEASSVVWGMPGAVAQAGICSAVLPIDDIGPWLRKAVMG